jgi:ADP-heptose:LPS heptosyltransferase
MEAKPNILLIRLKSIGDILFTLPAVHAVRENFPDARLHFLVSKEYAPLVRGFPGVDEIIPLDRAVYRSWNLQAIGAGTFQLLRRLRRPKPSLAIDFQGYGETEFFAWWSGAPKRWGNVYHRTRGWTYTHTARRDAKTHPAEWNLSLLRQCGLKIGRIRNEFILPSDALDEARKFFAASKLDAARPTLFLQPFTSAADKNWPLENFLALAQHWRSRGVQIIFGGGPSERIMLEPARAAGFSVSAGVPLMTTAGLMKFSTLVVGGDTGLLHLAVAMGKRVVMVMHATQPGSSYPFQHADWAVTPFAGKTVAEIQTATVIEASARAFSEQAGSVFC